MSKYIYRHIHRHLPVSGQKYLGKMKKLLGMSNSMDAPLFQVFKARLDGVLRTDLIGRHPCPWWGQRVRSLQTQALL